MNKFIKLTGMLMLLAVASLSLTGCKSEGCTNPLAVNYDEEADKDDGSCIFETSLEFHLHSNFGTSDFTYGTDYTLDNGRKVNISTARFYISNIRLMQGSTETPLTGVYAQYAPGKEHLELGEAPVGNYTGIRFDIGVDSVANFSDPALRADDHPLSSSSPTFDHWSWNSGYIFMKIEGRADTSATASGMADGPIVYHVGGLNFARTVDLSTNFNVEQGLENKVHISVDVKEFFENVDLTTDWDTHTMNNMPLANVIANNVQASVAPE